MFFIKFSGTETINEDLYTISFMIFLSCCIGLNFRLDNTIIKIDKNIKVKRENFCLVLFFKNADRIAIIKSSLLEAIILNIQST